MITPTSDCRQLVPVRGNGTTLKLFQHRGAAAEQAASSTREARERLLRDMRPYAAPGHQPTPAESYGCVDWFSY